MVEEAVHERLLPGRPPHETPRPVDTFWPCVANLSKVIIGAGMMAIPQAYSRIGSLVGSCMLVLVGLMTHTTLVFLLRGSEATGATTYSQLTRVMCGPAVMKVLQAAVLSFCFGFGVVYLVIIRDILVGTPPVCNGLLCELLGLDPTSSPLADARLVIVAVAVLVCAPLLLLRTMDRLAVLNVVGVGAIAMLATVAVGLGLRGLATGTAFSIPLLPQWAALGDTTAQQLQALTACVPVMIACYVAHQSLHPLMPLLQPYSDARMCGVIAAALVIAFAVFGSLAVGSGLAFGPALEVNVLNNFSVAGLQPMTGPLLARLLSWSIRGGYLLSLLASLLLYMHPLRACLAELVWPDQPGGGPRDELYGESAGLLPVSVAAATADGGCSSSPRRAAAAGSQSDPGTAQRAQGAAAGRGAGRAASAPGGQRAGSVFATPAAQATAAAAAAAAAAAGAAVAGQGSDGGLSTFDSMDSLRAGSWSQVRYVPHGAAAGLQGQHSPHTPAAAGPGAGAAAGLAAGVGHPQQQQQQHRWQQAEQRWYLQLTYGLLAAMVLVAIVVPNIWTALSAIGDLASTLQAFVVPGLIGVVLALHGRTGGHSTGSGTWKSPWHSRVMRAGNGAVGGCVVLLGLLLFANGIYQRV